jgi:hypothetical protein
MDLRLAMRIEDLFLEFLVETTKEGHWEKWSQEVKMIDE